MANRKVGSGKKVSTVGIVDQAVRKVLEDLAARVAALEIAVAAKGE